MTRCATRTIISQRGNVNHVTLCFTTVLCFCHYICFLLPIIMFAKMLWKTYINCNEIGASLWHIASMSGNGANVWMSTKEHVLYLFFLLIWNSMLTALPIVWDTLWIFSSLAKWTLISHARILPDLLSDHQVVVCFINFLGSPAAHITVTHRKTRDINLDALWKNICRVFSKESVDDLDDVITVHDNALRLLLDKDAAEQRRNITLTPRAPWFSDDLWESKRVKRRCERKFHSTKISLDKQIYYQVCRYYNHLLEVSKTNYLREKFSTLYV